MAVISDVLAKGWFDDTKTPGEIWSVGGYVGGAWHWEEFETSWAMAWEYADTDKHHGPDGVFDSIVTTPLPKNLTFKTVRALQAADFWAWEYRKSHLNLDEWWALEDRPQSWGDDQWEHMNQWVTD